MAVERGFKGIGGDRSKLRDKGAVGWGVLFWPLSFLVFLVLERRGMQRGRMEGESLLWRQCLAAAS